MKLAEAAQVAKLIERVRTNLDALTEFAVAQDTLVSIHARPSEWTLLLKYIDEVEK